MKYLLGVCVGWLLSVGITLAQEVVLTDITKPYDIVTIQADQQNQQWHLGALEGFPVMYEFQSTNTFELSLQVVTVVNQMPDDAKPSLMIVRENDDGSGVSEIARLDGREAAWQTRKDRVYGLTFLESEVVQRTYAPGTYRVEVSTPVNEGRYLLRVGSTKEQSGYFETIGQVRTVQKHFGYSLLRMLAAAPVYYLVGIIVLIIIFHRTWKLRKTIARVS